MVAGHARFMRGCVLNRTKKSMCKRGHVNPPRYAGGACVPCQKDRGKRMYAVDRAKFIARASARAKADPNIRRDEQRAWRMKTTVSVIRHVIAAADGKCEACGRALSNAQMCIDHCHNTGRLRGVLCRFCNAIEGIVSIHAERIILVQRYLDREISRHELNAATLPTSVPMTDPSTG